MAEGKRKGLSPTTVALGGGLALLAFLGYRAARNVTRTIDDLEYTPGMLKISRREVTLQQIKGKLGLRIYNPNRQRLVGDSIVAKIYLRGKYIGNVNITQGFTINPVNVNAGQTDLWLPFRLDTGAVLASGVDSLLSVIMALASGQSIQSAKLPSVLVRGYVGVDGIQFPFSLDMKMGVDSAVGYGDTDLQAPSYNARQAIESGAIASIARTCIPRGQGRRRLIKRYYDTNDIVAAIVATAQNGCFADTATFAPFLKGATVPDTLYNVWAFARKYIQYREDPSSNQWVKTPAQTVTDGYADCKSLSLLILSILKNLNIPASLRFVAWEPGGMYRHVYVVAPKQGNTVANGYYTLDACLPTFDTEKPYADQKTLAVYATETLPQA